LISDLSWRCAFGVSATPVGAQQTAASAVCRNWGDEGCPSFPHRQSVSLEYRDTEHVSGPAAPPPDRPLPLIAAAPASCGISRLARHQLAENLRGVLIGPQRDGRRSPKRLLWGDRVALQPPCEPGRSFAMISAASPSARQPVPALCLEAGRPAATSTFGKSTAAVTSRTGEPPSFPAPSCADRCERCVGNRRRHRFWPPIVSGSAGAAPHIRPALHIETSAAACNKTLDQEFRRAAPDCRIDLAPDCFLRMREVAHVPKENPCAPRRA